MVIFTTIKIRRILHGHVCVLTKALISLIGNAADLHFFLHIHKAGFLMMWLILSMQAFVIYQLLVLLNNVSLYIVRVKLQENKINDFLWQKFFETD